MDYPSYLNKLIDGLKLLPGVGNKSATRMAFQILEMKPELIKQLNDAFKDLESSIKYCKVCHNIAESDECEICLDKERNHQQICVVSNYKDIFTIEKTGNYQGVYHVLNGDIAINKGITPDKLNVQSLVDRINDDIQEVVIATNPTIEGETTALYVQKVLENHNVLITRIAYGLPIGSQIEIVDALTISKAFENRKQIKE